MFKIKVRMRPDPKVAVGQARNAPGLQPRLPSSQAYLLQRNAFSVDVFSYCQRADYAKFAFAAATAAVSMVAACLLLAEAGKNAWLSTVVASAMLVLAVSIQIFGRKISSIHVHRVPLGGQFPLISDDTTKSPKTPIQYLRHTFLSGDEPIDRFKVDLAVRLTEPNAAERLERYAKDGMDCLEIRSTDLDKDSARFFESFRNNKKAMQTFASKLATHKEAREDLWPLVRLSFARILYRAEQRTSHKRTIQEVKSPPVVKGEHYYMAYKLNLLPLGYWFVLISLSITLPNVTQTIYADSIQVKLTTLGLAMFALLWTVLTVLHNRRLHLKWQTWLTTSGSRPLGLLPIFHYQMQNAGSSKWEEIDEADFKVFLDEYVMDIAKTLAIVQGTFFAIAMTYLQWFK